MKKNTQNIKEYLALRLKRGVNSIRITDKGRERLKKSEGVPTRAIARQLLNERQLRLIPKSRRGYKIYYKNRLPDKKVLREKKIKFIVRPTHIRDLLRNKTVTAKENWMYHVRSARLLLREFRNVLGANYRKYYKRVSGGYYFRRMEDLREDLKNMK